MLKITGDGRKAALDMRLVDAFADAARRHQDRAAPSSESSTSGTTTSDERSTQLVFCDLSTPNPDRFNVYDEVRAQAHRRAAFPQQEIAFIHDADTDAAKKTLFDAVNAGRVRILIGSTEKMGAGTNVQKRLVALHHLDAPWRPRDIEQREGRILRQGNHNPEVDIYRYVTEGSFDAYMWQTLETKARFIQQVMSGQTSVRAAEDLEGGALTYAEIKAIASGNPAVMEKVKVDTEIRKLDQLRAAHLNQQHNIRWQIRSLPRADRRDAARASPASQADIATRDAHAGEEFTMTVGNRVYSGKGAREEAAKALTYAVLSWRDDMTLQVRGAFRGFEILSEAKRPRDLIPRMNVCRSFSFGARGPTRRISIRRIRSARCRASNTRCDPSKESPRNNGARRYLQKTLADYQAQANRPFEHEERLKELLVRQASSTPCSISTRASGRLRKPPATATI